LGGSNRMSAGNWASCDRIVSTHRLDAHMLLRSYFQAVSWAEPPVNHLTKHHFSFCFCVARQHAHLRTALQFLHL